MKTIQCFMAMLMAALLSACVTVQPTIAHDAKPVESKGYIVGKFSQKGAAFGFGLVNTASGEEYVLPFNPATSHSESLDNVFSMIQVPPGTYRLSYWLTYNAFKERISKKSIPASPLSLPFVVKPDAVVCLGSFEAKSTYAYPTTYWKIEPSKPVRADIQEAFGQDFPSFAKLPFTCNNCIEW